MELQFIVFPCDLREQPFFWDYLVFLLFYLQKLFFMLFLAV